MANPYKARLRELSESGDEVTVDRDGASSLTGVITHVDEDTFVIEHSPENDVLMTMIAYDDVRGITTRDFDPDLD